MRLSEITRGDAYAIRFAARSTADRDPEHWLASFYQQHRIEARQRQVESVTMGAIRAVIEDVGVPYGKTRCGVRVVVEEQFARTEPRSDHQIVLELDERGEPVYDIRDVTLTVHSSAVLRRWDDHLLYCAAWRLERERRKAEKFDEELRRLLEES